MNNDLTSGGTEQDCGVTIDTLDRARRGDNDAVESVFERYKGLVRAKSRSYFLIGADGEDLIQEGMIGLFKAIRDYRPAKNTSFTAFADLCVTRQIITAIHTASRRKHIPLNNYVSLSAPPFENGSAGAPDNPAITAITADPEAMLLDRERNISFQAGLKKLLSDLEIKVLSLYLKGMPYSEMAAALVKPEKSIDNALQRVKKKLAGNKLT